MTAGLERMLGGRLARCAVVCFAGFVLPAWAAHAQPPSPAPAAVESAASERAVIDRQCVTCHSDRLQTRGLSLEGVDVGDVAAHAEVWNRVVRKLRAGAMPPWPRPDAETHERLLAYIETALDDAARANPDACRTETFRRLNRTEYQNAIRDLLALEIDVTALLPRDDAAFGFDNVNTGGLSPTLMERYLAAARTVAELAVGSRGPAPGSRVVVVPADRTQEDHVAGLPFGTRRGTVVDHAFPFDGEYEIQVRLQRNRNENVEGLTEPHDVELTLDGERLGLFTMEPSTNMVIQANATYYADEGIDNHLNVHLPVTAGPHRVGAAFIKKNSALLETTRQPYVHDYRNLPIVVASAAGSRIAGGRHVKYDELTPMANLHLTLLDDVGVHLDDFADNTGRTGEIVEPLSL